MGFRKSVRSLTSKGIYHSGIDHYIMKWQKAFCVILGFILAISFVQASETILGESLPSTIEKVKALYASCNCYQDKKDSTAARECYEKVKYGCADILKKSPSDPTCLDFSIEADERIHELDGDFYNLPPGSNCTCIKNSSYDYIIAGYDNVLRLDPDSAKAWNNRGVLLGQLCCMKDARASFEEAIKINSSLAEPWYNKGVSLFYESPRDALECFNRSADLDPGLAEAWFDRYPLLMPSSIDMSNPAYRRAYKEAMASYNRSLELNPELALYKPPYLVYRRIE